MEIFGPVLSKMVYLFAFIVIGYLLSKLKVIPDNSAGVLSKLENYVFVPALVLSTFIQNCNVETLSSSWNVLLVSAITLAVIIPLSLALAKLCFKERFLQKIGAYGLAFSNFAFMGNAIMNELFPSIFFPYLIFTLPFWFMIYMYGAPVLLISDDSGNKKTWSERMRSFLNPMFIAMLIGILIGLIGLARYIPDPINEVITVSGSCMSPVAMLLTGMTIAKVDLLALLKRWRLYVLTAIKLVGYPLLIIGVCVLIKEVGGYESAVFNSNIAYCLVCVSCMPFGLNGIVIPAAYGKDTTDASGMALISHVLSVGTIPLAFMLFEFLIALV